MPSDLPSIVNFCTRWLPNSTTYSGGSAPDRTPDHKDTKARPDRARLAPNADEFAVSREDLDAMVASVGKIQIAVGPQRHGPHTRELAKLSAGAAPALHELAVGIELGDALVVAKLGDVKVAVLVTQAIADIAELARFAARIAADRPQQLALRRIDAHAMIVRIADDEVVILVDASPLGRPLRKSGGVQVGPRYLPSRSNA